MTGQPLTMDLNGIGTSSSPRGTVGDPETGRRQGTKRKKYAAKACHNCKRRKVKCSGDNVCEQCCSRDVRCCYSPPPPPSIGEQDSGLGRETSGARSSLPAVPWTHENESSSSMWLPEAHSDPRVEGLCDRVRALERMMTHLLKSPKMAEDSSPGATFQNSLRSGLPDEVDDTNQFAVRVTANDDLTLSSQVAAMSALLSKPPSPRPDHRKQSVNSEVLVEFPKPSALQHLIDVYFRDMHNYFPFLDQEETEPRIYSVIRRLGYSSYNRILVVTTEDLSIVALTCMMLSLAECLDTGEGACDGDTKPGWERYLQSCRAIQLFSHARTPNLDVVGAQCLIAAYLMHCENLGAASEAVHVTWKLAISIGLNNKKIWPDEDVKVTLQKQKLWWTLYFLDRQISRRSGVAYHIRDTEFIVDEFTCHETAVDDNVTSKTEWKSSITMSYLQALVNTARLWGHVWDTFFAVGAKKKGDWMEIEITDARILNSRRQLPKVLTWDSDELITYIISGEDEPHIRRRLQLFTRLELLRMLIRQNPVRQVEFNPETAHLCALLSREIIRAHDLYISRYPEARAIGYFTTSTTVECVYHLALVMHHSKDHSEHTACLAAFNQAHSILVRLSAYNNVAKRALKALNGVAKKWGSGNITEKNGGHAGMRQGEARHSNNPDALPQLHEINENNGKNGAEGFDIDLSEWMNVSMGSLYGNGFDFRLDNQV